ncbi:MFS transporter [Desulfurispira natronophila]|uniref:MFS family permease n=1 Tax=Desulfurispira natronophila TaxID=682562 RepID=A0A7W7Y440_9BACT|nr:MFS transporter [Desulfurispira natronophila]MBB5021746.1 MFS family permease [Desulfurispira natronophila]
MGATDKVYQLIINDEDARSCQDLPDSACREVPRNFFLLMMSQILTTLGDLLINPKTVLAWLMGAVGASGLVAWLVPVRESGSMLPQIVVGAWMRRKPVRKFFWVAGSMGQALSVLGMALSVWFLEGLSAGLGVLACLVAFSLARGFCSVAQKDVLGKTVPKGQRGRLTGVATTVSGLLVVGLSILLFREQTEPSLLFYLLLLLTAAGLWVVAGWIFAAIDEYEGETTGGSNALKEAVGNLRLVRDDLLFRRFVLTRGLLLSSALVAPYLVILAQEVTPGAWLLGVFMVASSLGSSASAMVWGWMADQSSRRVILRAGGLASLLCLGVGATSLSQVPASALVWIYPVAFFTLSIAHAGVRLGRKTYLVDMAGGNKRTDYTAVSNTLIGALLLVMGGVTALISMVSISLVILLLGLMALTGTVMAWQLKEV